MKKEILEVRLKGNCADTRDGVLRLGGAQSYGIYRLHITADEAWQGLAIAATFDCGGSPVTVVPAEDGLLDVPAEATASANTSCHPGSITFWGSNGDVRRVSARLLYRVYPTGSITGGNAIPPTPEVAEQLLARLDGKLDTPANTGAAGQVPVLQPDGSTLWGSVAGGTGTGDADGADGGYYAPSVTQPDANIMRVSFTQSKADMPDVPSKDITLPAGPAGLTPYIGDNGNWYLGNTDTGIKAAGSDGTTPTIGANGNWWIGGKDTGMAAAGQAATIEIVGTETLPADQPAAVVETEDSTAQARKYTVKVPQGNTGATPDIKIGTVETLLAGSAATASMTGTPKNPLLNLGIPKGADGNAGKSAYQYAVEGGYTGTEEAFAAKLAQEMPDKLPNPNTLTFTGAVTGSYDGSAPLSVEIPKSGSYTLPIASATQLGGVMPEAKTDAMNQPVGVDANGRLYAPAAALPTDDQVSTAVDAYLTANGVKCNDVWVDAGTITVAEGEAPTQLVWNLDGAIKKYYIEGTTIGHSGSGNLKFVVRSGTGTVCKIVQMITGNWTAGTTSTIYVKAEAEEKANGKFWCGLTDSTTFAGPPGNLSNGEENIGTNVKVLSIGAYWNNQALPVGTSFNLKVVYK